MNGDCSFFSKTHDFTGLRWLTRFPVPGTVFLLLGMSGILLENWWLLPTYVHHYTLRVMAPCWLLMWFMGIIAGWDSWLLPFFRRLPSAFWSMKVFREEISPGNIQASNTIINITQTEQITLAYLVLYMYAYMCVIAINEKGDHEFEKKEWGGQMGQLGKEKEEVNYVILL